MRAQSPARERRRQTIVKNVQRFVGVWIRDKQSAIDRRIVFVANHFFDGTDVAHLKQPGFVDENIRRDQFTRACFAANRTSGWER